MTELMRRRFCAFPLVLFGFGLLALAGCRNRWRCRYRRMMKMHREQTDLLREIRDLIKDRGGDRDRSS